MGYTMKTNVPVKVSFLQCFIGLLMFCSVIVVVVQAQEGRDLDTFNYRGTVSSDDNGGVNDYGPSDWDRVQCSDPDTCVGYHDKFLNSQGWGIGSTNYCQWCPSGGSNCGVHHQSPINVFRNVAVNESSVWNACIDGHWISYFDSSCSFDELRAKNAFVINRHSLSIVQPMNLEEKSDDNLFQLDCSNQPNVGGRRYGRMDLPKGYSHWFLLSHIDFKVPSEHTQEGKRYSGELQLHHYYSVTAEIAGVDNEMTSVAVFMDVNDGRKEWPILNRLICAWREAEEKNRAACGIPSVKFEYPGCYYYRRGHDNTTTGEAVETQGVRRNRQMYETDPHPEYKPATSAYDILLQNHAHSQNASHIPKKIHIEPENYESMDDFDWDQFLVEYYKEQEIVEQETAHRQRSRQLRDYEHVPWFNYFPLTDVRTEYYYRYSGTQTIPPCYAKFVQETRGFTNHWRVFKDPILISQRQLDELQRLIKERIAPKDAPTKSCRPDTAAKIEDDGKISVARPLQEFSKIHYKTFCECFDWRSKFEEDKYWCTKFKDDKNGRFFTHPYNYETNGF